MRKKAYTDHAITVLLILLSLLMITLTGCAKSEAPAEPDEPVVSAEPDEPVVSAEPAGPTGSDEPIVPDEPAEAETASGRRDGERFEAVIMLEGMEEPVNYEHVRNETLGFELDYEYESLERHSEPDRERFISLYDDPEDPWNYLEVRSDTEDADAAAAAVSAALSDDFNAVDTEPWTLDGAGSCIRIDAYDARESFGPMQTVYVIPAPGGCFIAAAHYTIESAEGYGTRFAYSMNTFSVIDGQG